MANTNKKKQRNQASANSGSGRQQTQQLGSARQSQQMGQERQPASDTPRKQFQQQKNRGRGQQR